MPQVVIFDTETTGIGNNHQIVEIAGVIYDTDFNEIVGEFDTLVRPSRSIDSGATLKHGLRSSDLSLAPTFEEIAPMLARIMHRRPAISYGISFDAGILNREFLRAGLDFQITQVSCALSPFGSQRPSLEKAALIAGHQIKNWHSALEDARAALSISSFHGWDIMLAKAGKSEHSASSVTVKALRTYSRFQAGLTDVFDLKRFSRLEEFRDATDEELYVLLLDEFLKDKQLSNSEIASLDKFAEDKNLTQAIRTELHRNYFKAIEAAALRGGVTEKEAEILTIYADILDVETTVSVTTEGLNIPQKGSLVCNTGDSFLDGKPLSRSEISDLIRSRGFQFTEQLNKSAGVSILIVADDGHTSGKTKKAEAWGIPITTLDKFLSALDD